MKWRPEGWKNDYQLDDYIAIFEEGADAMLKALRGILAPIEEAAEEQPAQQPDKAELWTCLHGHVLVAEPLPLILMFGVDRGDEDYFYHPNICPECVREFFQANMTMRKGAR